MNPYRIVLTALLLVALPCAASAQKAKSADPAQPSVVDSGSFTIMVNGLVVAHESFRMEQKSGVNVVSSQLSASGSTQATQSSELEVDAGGKLKRYAWREVSPSKASVTVEPLDDSFLSLKVTEDSAAPARETTHPLNPFTNILDDNFFSHIQVLVWRYIAMSCRANAEGQTTCNWQRQGLPIMTPRQQDSSIVYLEFTGRKPMTIRGAESELNSFKISTEAGDWMLWFNDRHQLVRLLIPSEKTEVVRD